MQSAAAPGLSAPKADGETASSEGDEEGSEAEDAERRPNEPIEAFMLEHFLITAWARDSIAEGNLEAIRTPLTSLADYEYRTVAPGGWMKGIAELQAAARLTAQAKTLEVAASGLAAMARVCGQCHREQGGPQVEHYKPERRSPKSDRLDVRMYRHAWAAERLWEGLTAPSDNAWAAGAAALAHAPAAAPPARPPLPQAVVKGLTRVRLLGERAADVETAEQRANIYGELLTTCAECHRHQAKVEF
jgi:cytochrome c553